MILGEDEKPSLEELTHFGVKGMKWGSRKYTNDPHNKSYTYGQRARDRAAFGDGAERRINRRMNEGKTYKQSFRREFGRHAAIAATVAYGATMAGIVLRVNGHEISSAIRDKAATNRGRAVAANLMGLPQKGSTIDYAKFKGGAHKITSL